MFNADRRMDERTDRKTGRQAGRQVGMTNLIVVIRTFTKTPTNGCP
jgi:hypothetical protein